LFKRIVTSLVFIISGCFTSFGADLLTAKDGVYVAKKFQFHTGEVLDDVKLAYKTLGDSKNPAVLVIHGTAGSAQSMLGSGFGGQLFGKDQVLDAEKYFIILPDALGVGKSTKPSDGLKAQFPVYNYDDQVDAQYRLVTEGLGIKHLRLVIGNSMGGMHAWVWAVRYPEMMDAIVPMASQPTAMSSRNWMMRRLMIEVIKADPDYNSGNYTTQPKLTKLANLIYSTGTNGGDLGWQLQGPTRATADALVDKALAGPPPIDTNDFIYQWYSSFDYDPSPNLYKIKTRILAINSADDERNPLLTGILVKSIQSIKTAKLYIIPASGETRGHGTTGSLAHLWAPQLKKFMATVPIKKSDYLH
jgi:homoserine O-acetyltransferase